MHPDHDWQARRRAELEQHDERLSARLDLERAARHADQVASAYAAFIGRANWHWFGHYTFRLHHHSAHGGVHPERADKAFRLKMSFLNRSLYGPRWAQKWHGGCMWARGQEFHKDGRVHFHAVISAPTDDLNTLARRMSWVDWWYGEPFKFGICRIGRPETQNDVVEYISKYVAKGGEIDLSKNFGAWEPPPLQYVAQVSGSDDWVGMTDAELRALEAREKAKVDPTQGKSGKR